MRELSRRMDSLWTRLNNEFPLDNDDGAAYTLTGDHRISIGFPVSTYE